MDRTKKIEKLVDLINELEIDKSEIEYVILNRYVNLFIETVNDWYKVKDVEDYHLTYFDLISLWYKCDYNSGIYDENKVSSNFDDAYSSVINTITELEFYILDPDYDRNNCEHIDDQLQDAIKEKAEANANTERMKKYIKKYGLEIKAVEE